MSKASDILDNVSKVIVGKRNVSELVLTSIIAGGHVLLEDVPGTGKTMMAKSFAKSIDGEFSRIQFTPDLLPSDITGVHVYNQKEGEFVFRRGPVFANVILADEINRATPRTQSALLECMEEHQVTVDGEYSKLAEPFIVIATQNPIETAGTYQLPEAQLDRFLMKINMGYPEKDDEVLILNRFLTSNPEITLEKVATCEDIIAMKEDVKNVYIHPVLIEYIVELARMTRNEENVLTGVSPRGTLGMLNAARAYAYVAGRDYVVPEDIKILAPYVWAHRLVLQAGFMNRDNKEQIIGNVVSKTAVPTEDWNR
ncbi:MoxR family ATPase [Lachnospira eligens]|jgi:MoxR-like ATPase|uniref:MoxR-like ATPase n=1 Tax=Lachnospira eligens (strain ATCC 27750 / DSM 3376 / VPI C15-48 / C15-B4) TaxID=515620 RepID=C4Z0W4_LACE2|nr:MoxR family ATPase [Lachnospira eligens]ACR72227.1 MoxR-like ATPase [[Eubacterium] eligens ATCC 27750]UEA96831.1 MoxR family ATPase [Lachnospira eligens]